MSVSPVTHGESHSQLVAELAEARANLLSVLESTPSMIWAVDPDLRLQFANEAFHRATSTLVGGRIAVGAPVLDDRFPLPQRAKWEAWYQRALAGEQFTAHSQDEVDGRRLCWDHIFSPIRNDEGRVVGTSVVSHDVSDRVQLQEHLARAELRFAEAQRIAGAGSWEWDPATNRTFWSDELFRIYDRDPALGAPSYEELAPYHDPADLETLGRMVTNALTTGEPYELDTSFVRRDGSRVWVTGRGEAVRSGTGAIVGLRGATLDITQRREIEHALSVRTDLYAMLARTNQAVNQCSSAEELYRELCGIAVGSGHFCFAWVGVVDEQKVSMAAHQGSSEAFLDELRLAAARDDRWSQGALGEAVATGESVVLNDYLASALTAPYHAAARQVGIRSSASLPLWEGGRVVAVLSLYASTVGFFTPEFVATLGEMAPTISFALDAFARQRESQRAADALRMSEERLRLALKSGRVGIFDWDLATDRVVWSNTHYEIFGYETDDLFPVEFRHFIDRVHPDDVPAVLHALGTAQVSNTPYQCEHRIALPDGTVRWIQGAGEFQYAPDGRPVRMLGTVADVTSRRVAEDALVMRDRAIQAVTEGIVITDPKRPDNPIVYVSPGFERLTGYAAAEVVGRNCRFMQGPLTDRGEASRMAAAVREGKSHQGELLNYRKDGSAFWNRLSITPVRDSEGRVLHFVGIQSDATERRSLEEQLRHSQKMEAVGQLAGGVAHDFNNLLTVINGYSDLMLADVPADNEMRELLTGIRDAGQRAAGLTQQLLAFSRRATVAPQVLDANDLVGSCTGLLRRLVGEHVSLAAVLSANACLVRIDPGQLEQVIVNLAVNSRDAMPTGGRLTIETAIEQSNDQGFEFPTGRTVCISVADTGTGMTDEVKARSFEPFFTTKGFGKGTGLGLAMVYGIVTQAGGTIHVESAVGRGTRFTVRLPEMPAEALPQPAGATEQVVRQGTETILLAEDEAEVRRLARRALEKQGYHVLEADSGARAAEIAGKYDGPIHLLVTDVVMPDVGGRALAETIRSQRPATRILFVSGYTDDDVLLHGVAAEADPFLQKPYTPTSLAEKVREVLDAEVAGGPSRE